MRRLNQNPGVEFWESGQMFQEVIDISDGLRHVSKLSDIFWTQRRKNLGLGHLEINFSSIIDKSGS